MLHQALQIPSQLPLRSKHGSCSLILNCDVVGVRVKVIVWDVKVLDHHHVGVLGFDLALLVRRWWLLRTILCTVPGLSTSQTDHRPQGVTSTSLRISGLSTSLRRLWLATFSTLTTRLLSTSLSWSTFTWMMWPLNHGHHGVESSRSPQAIQVLFGIHIGTVHLVELFRVIVPGIISCKVGFLFFCPGVVGFRLIIPFFFPVSWVLIDLIQLLASIVRLSSVLSRSTIPSRWTFLLRVLAQDEVHRLHGLVEGQATFSQLRHHQLALLLRHPTSSKVPPSTNLLREVYAVGWLEFPLSILEVLGVVLQRLSRFPLKLHKEGLKVIGQLRQGLELECRVQAGTDRSIGVLLLQVIDAKVFNQVPCPASQ